MSEEHEPLSIATYPWKTTDAMRLLEQRDKLRAALNNMSLFRKEWVPAQAFHTLEEAVKAVLSLTGARDFLQGPELRYLEALLGEEAPRLSAEECELRGMKGLAELAGGEEAT